MCQTELTESWKVRCFGFAQHPQCLVHVHGRIMLEWLRRSMMRWSSRRVTATIQGSTTEHPRVSSARRRHSEEPNRTGGPRSSALEAILAKSILVVVSCNHLSATGLSEWTQALFPDLKACAKSHSAAQQGRWLTGSTTLVAHHHHRSNNLSYLLAGLPTRKGPWQLLPHQVHPLPPRSPLQSQYEDY